MNTNLTVTSPAPTSSFSTEYVSPMTCEWVNNDVRILVVDDERLMRDLMALSLRRFGYDVEAVADGHTALTLLENEYFDLVMLDVVMPDMDGFTLLQRTACLFRCAGDHADGDEPPGRCGTWLRIGRR